MELVGLISVAVMPWLVKWGTDKAKTVNPIAQSEYRVALTRAVVAVLALAGAVLSFWLGDLNEVDGQLIETALLAGFNALMATWLHFRGK